MQCTGVDKHQEFILLVKNLEAPGFFIFLECPAWPFAKGADSHSFGR